MTLPTDFQFSQASLQDYVDCPRRFQLRYVEQVAWPAPEAEPALENERYLQQGAAFHRLIHQHLLGLPPERLSSAVTDDDLRRWWDNYLASGLTNLPDVRHPEVLLSAPMNDYRLVAKYDLVAINPMQQLPAQRAIIVDWKTSRKRSRREWLAGRLQTRVYPYLLVRAGDHLNDGQPFEPEQVEMVYWFANFSNDPEHFAYDAAQHNADEVYLTSLIEEIKNLGRSKIAPRGLPNRSTEAHERPRSGSGSGDPDQAKLDLLNLRDHEWSLTTQERHCRYCPYRSLCQRGVRAGPLDEIEETPEPDDDFDISIEFEQIAEIEY